MSEDVTDPTEDIADAIVETLNGALADSDEDNFNGISFEAINPPNPKEVLEAVHNTLLVCAVPFGESEEKIGKPKFLETHEVDLWVIRQVDATWTRKKLSGFMRTLRDYLRGQKMATYTYSGAEIVTKFDINQLHKNQFLSVCRLSYKGIP